MSDFSTMTGCVCYRCEKARNRKVANGATDRARVQAARMQWTEPMVVPKLKYTYEVRDFHNNPEAVRGDYISGGCYGKVYGHKNAPGLVVKEFDVADGYPVWMAYAALAYRQGMGNSVLPRIYAVSLPDRVDSQMKGHVLMERLDKRVADVDMDTIPGFEAARDRIERLAASTLSGYNSDYLSVLHTGYKSVDRFYSLSAKHMHRVSAAVRAAGVGLNTDMHSGNFMLRKDEFVITDPFTLEYTEEGKNKEQRNARLYSLLTRMCKEAAAFTPGFYSEYALRREINIS